LNSHTFTYYDNNNNKKIYIGIVDASRYVTRDLLEKGKHSIALCPGGATEALYAGRGRHTLYLKKRLGFVRMAMQTGTPIVPMYSFGENDTYTTLNSKHEVCCCLLVCLYH
jgi:hypothetical protein